jgi:hypothetical protein
MSADEFRRRIRPSRRPVERAALSAGPAPVGHPARSALDSAGPKSSDDQRDHAPAVVGLLVRQGRAQFRDRVEQVPRADFGPDLAGGGRGVEGKPNDLSRARYCKHLNDERRIDVVEQL